MTDKADDPQSNNKTGADPDRANRETSSPVKPKSRASLWPLPSIAVAAIIGAVLSIGVLFGLQQGGLWPAPAPADLGPLEARVTALESSSGARDSTGTGRMEASIERLRDRVAAVEARPTGGGAGSSGPDLSPALNDLSARVDTLSRRLPSDLESRLAGMATTEQLAGLATADQIAGLVTAEQVALLEARIEQLEADIQHTDTRRAARALALAQLVRATRSAEPFEVELAALAAVRADDARLAQLAPFAASGAPTMAMLRAEFEGVARRATRAAHAAEQPTAWDQVWRWLGQAISFRRTDAIEGDGADAVVARAEARLAEGNLAAALAEMQSLGEGPRAEAAEWIAAAEARVALDAVMTAVAADLLAEIGG